MIRKKLVIILLLFFVFKTAQSQESVDYNSLGKFIFKPPVHNVYIDKLKLVVVHYNKEDIAIEILDKVEKTKNYRTLDINGVETYSECAGYLNRVHKYEELLDTSVKDQEEAKRKAYTSTDPYFKNIYTQRYNNSFKHIKDLDKDRIKYIDKYNSCSKSVKRKRDNTYDRIAEIKTELIDLYNEVDLDELKKGALNKFNENRKSKTTETVVDEIFNSSKVSEEPNKRRRRRVSDKKQF